MQFWCDFTLKNKAFLSFDASALVINRVVPIIISPCFSRRFWLQFPNGRTSAESVLTVLRARFKEVAGKVEETIRQMIDPIALDSWAAQAATCQSLDEFAEALR